MAELGFFVCLDLGQLSDYSAMAILEVREHLDERHNAYFAYHARHLYRWPLRTSYPTIVREVSDLMVRDPLAGHSSLAADGTGVGRPIIDMLSEAGLYPISITITGGAAVIAPSWNEYCVPKRDLVSSIQAALQRRRLRIAADLPEAKTLQDELANFEVKVSAAAHDTYGTWREGKHDDLVLAISLGVWLGSQGRRPGDSAVRAW
jgi:hypothetical protein